MCVSNSVAFPKHCPQDSRRANIPADVFDSAGNQKTATTPDATVLAGTDSSCLAQNAGSSPSSQLEREWFQADEASHRSKHSVHPELCLKTEPRLHLHCSWC